MSFWLGKVLGSLLLPPLGPVLMVVIGVYGRPARSRMGRSLAGLGLLLLVLFSLPGISILLIRATQVSCEPLLDRPSEAEAIVVLGGGVRRQAEEFAGRPAVTALQLERLRYAARLARHSQLPVLVTGGRPFGEVPESWLMRETLLEDFGVRVRWVEDESTTTRENARNSAALLQKAGIERIWLVSQGWHLERAVEAFRREGLKVTAAATGCRGHKEFGWNGWIPSPEGFEMSYWALHEVLGRLWYWLLAVGVDGQ